MIKIAVILFFAGYYIQKQHYRKRIDALDQKKNEIENNLQPLTGQLNPHFLFNSLNAVQGLIRQNDHDAASQDITEVATFMRTIMDAGRKELVSLKEKIQMEERYISLEQNEKLLNIKLINKCAMDLSKIDFPPMLLQPIIENSIRHGFAKSILVPLITITFSCVRQ